MSGSRYDVLYLSDSDTECDNAVVSPPRRVRWHVPLVVSVHTIPARPEPEPEFEPEWQRRFEWGDDDDEWE